ncbi:MAG TPA: outer membrane lipoprotein chaperone LolA [Pyrinomonadaceae bacterium]
MTRRGKRRTGALVLLMLYGMAGLYVRISTVSATPSPTAQSQVEADDLIKRIETRYGRMRGLAADFEQTYSGPGVRTRRESGRLFLERPRRMRWEYDPKPGKLFIVNGREVWFYVPADREATHADASQVSDARFPFLFLLGNTSLRRVFRSITLIDQQVASRDTRTLRLVPRANIQGLREIYLEVLTDGTISRIKIVDEAGASSEVSLTNVRENFIAPPEAFQFRPPPGVTIRRL